MLPVLEDNAPRKSHATQNQQIRRDPDPAYAMMHVANPQACATLSGRCQVPSPYYTQWHRDGTIGFASFHFCPSADRWIALHWLVHPFEYSRIVREWLYSPPGCFPRPISARCGRVRSCSLTLTTYLHLHVPQDTSVAPQRIDRSTLNAPPSSIPFPRSTQ